MTLLLEGGGKRPCFVPFIADLVLGRYRLAGVGSSDKSWCECKKWRLSCVWRAMCSNVTPVWVLVAAFIWALVSGAVSLGRQLMYDLLYFTLE
ncbi:hypothetical protein F2Q69_00046216 [Brassica cretica]|uniref:Uncharacterized protein n=1 Tax=Brassica cretica TaxID=69181 RepID=A0A8S9PJ51_BRACR|nr:hypothetical protein F2Q69_00046216 [Brassica cretica]